MQFKKDKTAIIFLIVLIILGIYLRFSNYNEIGYTHDALLAVTGSVAWFYPYPYFPGVIYMGPALGNMIIGTGCMLSGEDFSGVTKVSPKFSPNIPILIGPQLVKAESYCKIPIYLFGLIFFLLISLLAILLFRSYYALFPIAFFTFSQFILEWSRIISVDVISYVFIFAGLIFLWKAYIKEKASKKENIFFILCFFFLGFAGATKFSAGIYAIFAFLFFLGKYWRETKLLIKKILKTIKLKISEKINIPQELTIKPFIKKGIIYFIVYAIALLIPYKLNPKNFLTIYLGFKEIAPYISSMRITSYIFDVIHTFVMKINTLDLLIFIFSIFIFIKLIFKKQKRKNEKFILYFVFLFIFTGIFFGESTGLFRVAIPLLISIILLMSLSFSNKSYSLFNLLKIPFEKRRKIFFIFLSIYILYSLLITVPHAPYYFRGNEIICTFEKENCDLMVTKDLTARAIKPTVNFLKTIMQDNETFLYHEGVVPQVYARHSDDWVHYQTFKDLARAPTLEEEIEYFHPEDRNLRYFPVRMYGGNEDERTLREEYVPNYIIRLDNKDIMNIYDLYNLTKKF